MRSVNLGALSALLVISLAGLSQVAGSVYTGDAKSVKELIAIFNGAKTAEDGKVVTAAGAEVPVKNLIQLFEGLKECPVVKNSGKADLLPPEEKFTAAIEKGEELDFTPVCSINRDVEFTKSFDWWFEQTCSEDESSTESEFSFCKLRDDPELAKPFELWWAKFCEEGGDSFDLENLICKLTKEEFSRPTEWDYTHDCDSTDYESVDDEDEEDSSESTGRSPSIASSTSSSPSPFSSRCEIKVTAKHVTLYDWWKQTTCTEVSVLTNPFCSIEIEITTTDVEKEPEEERDPWYNIFYKLFCVPS